MSSFALALAAHAVLAANPFIADAEFAGPMAPPASCGLIAPASAEGVAQITSAPVGGRWWLPRTDENGQPRIDPNGVLSAVAGNGDEHALLETRVTPSALSIVVPSSLTAGEALQLRVDGIPVQGVLLRVAEAPAEASQVSLGSIEVLSTTPETCDMACRFEGMTVPAAPLLRLRYSGGPAILDAWATSAGMAVDDLTPRVVDSELLAASVEEREVELRLDEIGFTSSLDVRVRLLAPDTLEVLHDETLFLAPLEEIPAETVADVPLCEGRAIEPTPPFGCGGGAVPLEAAAFALPLLLFGAWRRRRQRR